MIAKIRSQARTVLLFAAATLFSAPAFADTITLSLANPTQTSTAGSTVSFSGTVSVTGNASPVNLDDFLTIARPVTGNDDGYFNNVYFNNFNSGDSISSLFFTISLPSNLASGTYAGTFQVYEEGNPAVSNTQNFQVTIPGSASPVPEPSSWALLSTGLTLGIAAFTLNGKLKRPVSPLA